MTPRVSRWRRRPTRAVRVGGVVIGGDAAVVVQSMTVTDTADTAATAEQVAALQRAGCEVVRITAPSLSEARDLRTIREALHARGVRTPLVADIHFTPNAAMEACDHVEKVRVNPGNYADRKRFDVREYSDEEYASELDRLGKAFAPLVLKAKSRGIALRIGTNHGSLSDRIMNRFGDSPLGMVESALEFVRICEAHDYRNLVLSAKASSVRVMVGSYRLMAETMDACGMDYPLHLGVTEAGDGEDGRIKSAVGIGMLLYEGLGDTIRVSLTEDPVKEVPVCREIVHVVEAMLGESSQQEMWPRPREVVGRRRSAAASLGPLAVGAASPPRVMLGVAGELDDERRHELLRGRPWDMAEMAPEGFELRPRSLGDLRGALALHRSIGRAAPVLVRTADLSVAQAARSEDALVAIDVPMDAMGRDGLSAALRLGPPVITFVGHARVGLAELAETVAAVASRIPPEVLIAFDPGTGPVLRTEGYRALAEVLSGGNPILLRATSGLPQDLVRASIELGSLLVDGIGDVVTAPVQPQAPLNTLRLLYNVLQASGSRISKTEYISCPSCGRTVFDLEETTARIKARTGHLKGLKIAVMGCIVNGPGEMADADFGYVGASPGSVHLFVGKEMVERSLPAERADLRLVELIKAHGKWVDPPGGAASPAGV